MPLFVGDYLADTTHLTCTEHGAYMLLLMSMWRSGGALPNDHAKLSRFARCTPGQWARISETILAFFDIADGVISHGRLSREMTKHSAAVEQRRQAASNGGKAKALKNNRSPLPDANLSLCQPEPEPEPEEVPTEPIGSAAPKRTKARGSRRVPNSWSPSELTIAKLVKEGHSAGDLERALTRMRDHEYRDAHTDWDAAFRNWVRIDADRKPRHERPHPDAKLAARHANYAAAWEGSERAAGRDWKP